MANHKSALKAHKRSVTKAKINVSVKSKVKTFIKRVDAAITAGDHAEARVALSKADSQLMKAVGKGVYKLNTAARYISNLAQKVKLAALQGK